MKSQWLSICLFSLLIGACQNQTVVPPVYSGQVLTAGAMRRVMHQGKLDAIVRFDSLTERGWYGLGPAVGLRGEVFLWDGEAWISRIDTVGQEHVQIEPQAGAPFFVYAQVAEWQEYPLPDSVKDLASLENHLATITAHWQKPFPFYLSASLDTLQYHVQNLAEGSIVRSPEEAHRGQVNVGLSGAEGRILGFFSREHQGVFTHHDTWMHLHFFSRDQQHLGHLDAAQIGEARLYLPL
jgi:Alpha-acetolactate decarboxylase